MNVVEKYGGTSVGTIEQIKAIAAHAAKCKARGDNLVIVASAMGKTTNKLIAMANEIGEHVNERELDSLLSTGEQRTITLLAMAIDALGVSGNFLDRISVWLHNQPPSFPCPHYGY